MCSCPPHPAPVGRHTLPAPKASGYGWWMEAQPQKQVQGPLTRGTLCRVVLTDGHLGNVPLDPASHHCKFQRTGRLRCKIRVKWCYTGNIPASCGVRPNSSPKGPKV